jgi:hypothetical protein
MKRVALARGFLAIVCLLGPRVALAGQAPGAASDPDIPISHRDRVYSAEQFSNTAQDAELQGVGGRDHFQSRRFAGRCCRPRLVHLRKVNVVRDLGQELEINSGVRQGDQVVLNPAVDLADGSRVQTRVQAVS